jgi:hypothetical protein
MAKVAAKMQREEAKTKTTSTMNITLTSTSWTWSGVEHSQFEQGVVAYGWGNWAAMARANIVPTRDRDQLNNYGKVFRRRHPADYQRLIGEHAANYEIWH